MDKQSTIRTIRASYKIDQVENGWTVATSDGNMFVFADSKELAEWFCMIVGVPVDEKKAKEDPLESEIRKLVKSYHLVEDCVEYVDGYKFAGGRIGLLDREKTRKMIQLCHQHDLYVSTGGFIERVIVQGPDAVDKYLEECKSLEFDMVEVSSGLAPINLQDKVAIVKQVQNLGMKAKPEVSMMIGAGAGT